MTDIIKHEMDFHIYQTDNRKQAMIYTFLLIGRQNSVSHHEFSLVTYKIWKVFYLHIYIIYRWQFEPVKL